MRLLPHSANLWSPWFRIIMERFAREWWVNLKDTMVTDKYLDVVNIHRFDPPSIHRGGAGVTGLLEDMTSAAKINKWVTCVEFCLFVSHLRPRGPNVLGYTPLTATLPTCLWTRRILPSFPGSRLMIFFYHDASSALLQLVMLWLNVEYYLLTFSRFPH